MLHSEAFVEKGQEGAVKGLLSFKKLFVTLRTKSREGVMKDAALFPDGPQQCAAGREHASMPSAVWHP